MRDCGLIVSQTERVATWPERELAITRPRAERFMTARWPAEAGGKEVVGFTRKGQIAGQRENLATPGYGKQAGKGPEGAGGRLSAGALAEATLLTPNIVRWRFRGCNLECRKLKTPRRPYKTVIFPTGEGTPSVSRPKARLGEPLVFVLRAAGRSLLALESWAPL